MSTLTAKATILVLIALPEEHEAFLEVFPSRSDVSSQTSICLEHEHSNPSIRLVSILAEEMGTQGARQSADLGIKQFDPDLIVVLGIAGGISDDLKVGDVCVSNEIIDVLNNTKVSENNGISEISFSPVFYPVDAELVASFTFLRSNPSYSKIYRKWQADSVLSASADRAVLPDYEMSRLHVGPIACGPVSSSVQFNTKLKGLHRKVAAIETESGGVLEKASLASIEAIAIRGISDLADADKAGLEKRTGGVGRRLAMRNASELLAAQLQNDKFSHVLDRLAAGRSTASARGVQPAVKDLGTVAELEQETKARLRELSTDFKARPDGFYLPIPRVRKVSFADELSGRELDEPENIVDCLQGNDRILVRLPRSFPSQALGWSIAYSLLRQQIDDKVVLPFVVQGTALRPPKTGLWESISSSIREDAKSDDYCRVFIIEEPCFETRSRLRFLSQELNKANAKIMVLTKSEDHVAEADKFVRENNFAEFELAPISFSETAFFLERAFDMSPHEAEAVAIRLDDTFRKFRLDAHPTYFAGLQEETLAALINANKRAELIQLAVDGLLTLIVAADKSKPSLSRTTRERFLKRLVLEGAQSGTTLGDPRLSAITREFLDEYAFDISQAEFLNPFFQMGLLYQSEGIIRFTHPYLESYLLAQALREQPEVAIVYFEPERVAFNYYAYDLYCEMGPDIRVVAAVRSAAERSLAAAAAAYPAGHVYLDKRRPLTALSNARQLGGLAKGLVSTAQKLERDDSDENVRAEKQRIIDAKSYVRTEVVSRRPDQARKLPKEIEEEFDVLDSLSRALALCSTSIGSGSEALDGDEKRSLGRLVVGLAGKFSDVWTRNRLRIDFEKARKDILSDENIWQYIEETGASKDSFDSIKAEVELFLHGAELNAIVEPMGRILWRISSAAGVKVLAPILAAIETEDPVARVVLGCWLMDVDPKRGREVLKGALAAYKGSSLLRVVVASHLLWRVFWHHYKTPGAPLFVSAAKRALAPVGLAPTAERVEQVQRGPYSIADERPKRVRSRPKSGRLPDRSRR